MTPTPDNAATPRNTGKPQNTGTPRNTATPGNATTPETADTAGTGPLPLAGRTALVAGGTRGAGRGIAVALGAAGATVVVSGRSTRAGRSDLDRPETIEQTAEQVTAAGGRGIPIRCDHSDPAQVADLVGQIREVRPIHEHGTGGLDILVNDIWGGDALIEWKPVWEHDLRRGLDALRRAIETHIITSHHALPLLLDQRSTDPRDEPNGTSTAHPGGLVVEITDGDERTNALFPDGYRGGFFYDLIKKTVIQLARTQAAELRPYGVAAVALTPGFLRSEEVLDHFGVSERNWRDGIAKDPHFAYSETPAYVGRAVAALAADPQVLARTGQSLEVAELAREYGFTDRDGTRPDFASYFREVLVPQLPLILQQAREQTPESG